MKKSNYLILVISVLASAFLLYLWWALGFNKVDNPLDMAISIVWWIVVVLLVVLINRWEQKRQRAVRTVYLAATALYNSETGVQELEDGKTVEALETLLAGLTYGFKVQDAPAADEFDYRYVVKSDRYKAAAKADGANDSENSEAAEPTWEGTVIAIDRENGNTETKFSNRAELAAALAPKEEPAA